MSNHSNLLHSQLKQTPVLFQNDSQVLWGKAKKSRAHRNGPEHTQGVFCSQSSVSLVCL